MGWLRVTHKVLIGSFALRSQRFEHYQALHFFKVWPLIPKSKVVQWSSMC